MATAQRFIPLVVTADGRQVEANFDRTLGQMERRLEAFNRKANNSFKSAGFTPSDLKSFQTLSTAQVRDAAEVGRAYEAGYGRAGGAAERFHATVERGRREAVASTIAASEKETSSVISGYIKRGQAAQAETAKTDRTLNAAAEAEIKRAAKVRDEGLKAAADYSAWRKKFTADVERDQNRAATDEIRRATRVRDEGLKAADRAARDIKQMNEAVARDHDHTQQRILRAQQQAARQSTAEWEASANRVKTIVTAVAAVIVFTIGAVVAASTNAALRLDTLMRSLTAVAGSRAAADEQFARAREIAKLPGLGIQESVEGLVKLQAASTGLKELNTQAQRLELAETTLRRFGNALATVGKGKAELSGVNEQLAQILGKNKIMAQDIRILSEYVPQLRGAITAAFGTADTEELQKRGIGAVEFLTKVNAELAKLPQVTGGPRKAIENFGDAVFLAGARIGETFLPALQAVLELLTPLVLKLAEARGAILLVTVAVLAATVAMVAFHTSAVGGVIAGVGRLISSLQAVYVSMRLVAAGATTMAASTVVGVAGWVGLVAVLGLVAYGIYSVATAEKELASVSDEQVQATQKQIGLREAELELLTRLGDGTRATAAEQARQKELYDALDAGSQARVKALAEETSQTQALAEETRRLLEMERDRQRIQGANLAAKFTQELTKYNEKLAERARLESTLLAAERRSLRGEQLPAEDLAVAAGQQRIIDLSNARLGELRTEIEAQEKSVRGLARSLVNYRNTTEHSIESAFELAKTLNLSKGETAALVAEVIRLAEEQKKTAGSVDEATAALERHLKVTRELAEVYDKESKQRRDLIEGTLTIIANSSGGDLAQAKEQLRQYMKDPAFREAVETERSVKRLKKALDEIIDPDKVRHQKDAVEKLSDRLKQLKADVASFSDLKSPSFDTRFEAEGLERVKRDYEHILDLRRELRLPLRAALPGPTDEAGLRAAVESLEAMKRVRDDVLKVTYEQRDAEEAYAAALATSTIPVIDAGLRAETKYLKALRDRANAERELTSDLIVQTRLRRDAVNDEVGSTKKAYESVRLDLLKQLGDLDEAVSRNQLLSLLERGGELDVQTRISGRVDVKPPAPPSELKTIAENSVKQTASLQHIEQALTRGDGGGAAAARAFSAREALPVIEEWLREHGRGGAITARGQSATHNRLNLDHRNSIDVGLAPGSELGRQFIAFLESKGFPYRAITAADIARGVKGTGEHVHVGEPSRGTSQNFRPGTLAGAASSDAGPSLIDRARAFVGEWAQKLSTPQALLALAAIFTPVDEVVRTNSTVVAGPSYESLAHERALKTAIKERGDRERELTEEIRQNEYRLAFDLIDIDLEVAAARSRTRVERRDEERAVEVELAALRADAADAEATARRRVIAAKQEELDLTKRAVALQDEYANAGVNAALRQQVAVMEEIVSIRRADVEAVEQQARAQVRLADATVLHGEQVRARVLDHLASQSSITDAWAEGLISSYDHVASFIDRGIEKLTHGVGLLDSLLKSVVRSLLSRVWQQFLDALFPSGRQSQQASPGGSLLGALFGGGQRQGGGLNLGSIFSGAQGGGVFNLGGGGAGGGLDLGALLAATGGANPSNPLARALSLAALDGAPLTPQTLTDQLAQSSGLRQVLGGAGRQGGLLGGLLGGAGGGSLLGGALAAGGTVAPLLGLQLGIGAGGPSTLGKILGGIGGGVLGLSGLAAAQLYGAFGLGGGILPGFAVGLLTNPITIAAAALLIPAAIILGKNAARRRDERTRDKFTGDALAQLDALIRQVRANQLDGGQALQQAAQIREQYVQQAEALKDSKTRRIALADVSRLDLKIASLRGAADQQLKERALDEKLVPEFDGGGRVTRTEVIKVRPGEVFMPPHLAERLHTHGGIVPGVDTGRDSVFMPAAAGSLIFNRAQQRGAARVSPRFAVSTFDGGGDGAGGARRDGGGGGAAAPAGDIHIHADEITIDMDEGKFVARGLKTSTGQRAFWHVNKVGLKQGKDRE